jgi:hypothetical protein
MKRIIEIYQPQGAAIEEPQKESENSGSAEPAMEAASDSADEDTDHAFVSGDDFRARQ